jgi:ribosomal protein L37AE/L43A
MTKVTRPTLHPKQEHHCRHCGDDIGQKRWALGYKYCLDCGDTLAKQKKYTIAPINKSNYTLITDPQLLKQLNPKRTT